MTRDIPSRVAIVLSVRVNRETADRLQSLAKRRGTTMSAVAREALESFMGLPTGSSADGLSISIADGSVIFTQGHGGASATLGALSTYTDAHEVMEPGDGDTHEGWEGCCGRFHVHRTADVGQRCECGMAIHYVPEGSDRLGHSEDTP